MKKQPEKTVKFVNYRKKMRKKNLSAKKSLQKPVFML